MADRGVAPLFDIASSFGSALNTFAVLATTSGIGFVLRSGHTGSIRRLGVNVASRIGNLVGDLQVETLTGTPRVPSGSLWSAGATTSITVTGTGWLWGTLGTDAPVTAEQAFGVALNATTASAGDQATFNTGLTGYFNRGFPYALTKTAGAYSALNQIPIVGVEYADGYIEWGGLPLSAFSSGMAIASDTTPDEVGTRWVQPATEEVFGIIAQLSQSSANAAGELVLYADGAELGALDIDGDELRANSGGIIMARFNSPPTITPGAVGRVVVRPSTVSATGNYRVTNLTMESAASLISQMGLPQRTERTNAGAWTDRAAQVCSILPVFKSVAGGAPVVANMRGGFTNG